MREPDKEFVDRAPKKNSEASCANQLDPRDQELFLKTWDLKDGEMTDLQILMAIKNGLL